MSTSATFSGSQSKFMSCVDASHLGSDVWSVGLLGTLARVKERAGPGGSSQKVRWEAGLAPTLVCLKIWEPQNSRLLVSLYDVPAPT